MSHRVRIPLLRSGKPLLVLFFVFVVILSTTAIGLRTERTALAATGNSINFQARLMNSTGAVVPDGYYNVEFKIYNASAGGTLQFTDTYYDSNGAIAGNDSRVRVANGYLTVSLGSQAGNSFPSTIKWDQQMWITMNIGGVAQTATPTWDGEMNPRLQLTAVPYAFRAGQLASLAGSFTGVLKFASSFGQDSTITLPDPGSSTATVCYQTSASCGFATGSAGDYIQNGTAQQTANFNILGSGAGNSTMVVRGVASGTVPVAIFRGGTTPGASQDILSVQDATGTNTFFKITSTGTLQLAGGLSPDITTAAATAAATITLQPGMSSGASSNGAAVNITAGSGSGTTAVTGGTLTLQGGSATGGSGTRNGGSVVVDAGTGATANGNVTIGGTNAGTIAVGSTTNSSGTQTINVGANNTAGATVNVTVGSGSSATGGTTTVRAKGAVTITAGAASTWSTSSGALTIQGAGGVNIASTGVANTVQIGNTSGAVSQTINIGTNATASSTNNVNIGSGTTASSTVVNGGTGSNNNITLQTNNASTGVLVKSTTNSTATLQIQNSSAAVLWNADTTNGWVINNGSSSPGNLLENPGFESNGAFTLSGWNYTAQSSLTVDSTNAHGGNNELVMTPNGTTFNVPTAKYYAVTPGDQFYTEAWYKAAASTNAGASISFAFYDKDKTNSSFGAVTNFNPANTSYTLATNTATVPAGKYYMRLFIGTNATSTTGGWYVDDVYVARINEQAPKLFKTTANSTNAFQIQDASNNSLFNVDTSGDIVTLGGSVKVTTLAAATGNSAAVCRDTSTNILTACDTNGTGAAFLQGGNSFGANGVLGTNDTNSLQFKTSGIIRGTFGTTNDFYFGNGVTAATPNNFVVAGSGSSTAGVAGANLTIKGGAGATTTTGSAGGSLNIQGGAAGGSGNNNGGNVLIQGGVPSNSGTSGGVTIRNPGDTTSAFQVQNASSVTLLGVDSAGAIVSVGSTGTSTLASQVLLGTSTGATQTVAIGGATANTAANGTTVLVQGGNTASAVAIEALASGTISIGTAAASSVVVGSATATTDLTLGQTTGTSTISIGSGSPTSTNTQTINIGNGNQTTASTVNVSILSSASNNTNGTATLKLGNSDRVTQIDLGNVVADAARTLNVFTGNATTVDTINIGTGATTVAGGKTIHIGDGAPTGTGTNLITIGSIAALANVTTIQGGNTSAGNGAVSIQAAASGVITVGTVNNNQINLGGSSSVVKLGALGASTTSAIAVCRDSSTANFVSCASGTGNGTPFLQGGNSFGGTGVLGASDNNALQIKTNNIVRATFDNATNGLYLGLGVTNAAPTAFTLAATGSTTAGTAGGALLVQGGAGATASTGSAGGGVTIQGGAGGGSNANNGGDITIIGGAGSATGVKGVVNIGPMVFNGATLQSFSGGGTITQANVDSFSTVLVSETTTAGSTVALPDPTNQTVGHTIYVTSNTTSLDFTLSANGGNITIAMRKNATATMIWNGSDWTPGGADSSTTLQAAYNNTLISAGGAEIILNNNSNTGGLTIRDNPTSPITGSLLEVQSAIGTNILSVNDFSTELMANGGAEDSSTFSTNWSALGTSTIARTTTTGQFATGQSGVSVTAGTTLGNGLRGNLGTNPAVSTTYLVSFTAKLASGSAFTDLRVDYTPTGATTGTQCTANQTIVTTTWTKITCEVTTPATTVTNADILIYQPTTAGVARVFYIDNLSMSLAASAGGLPSNVQVGGGINGGQVSLFTLDRSSSAPVAGSNSAYLGSLYYDTTIGRIQCYETDGWGSCGSAPDNIIILTPEFAGATLNGTGIGTMTSDFCAQQAAVLNINTTLCPSGEARNFYKWTSPQSTQQVYSIYISYKLPSTFKNFADDNTINLTARTDNTTNGIVTYEVFKSTGTAITACGTETTVTTSINTWQTVPVNGNENTSCAFGGSNTVIFKINVKAQSAASAYVGNLTFTYTNN